MRDVWRYGRQETGANNDAFTTQMCWVCVCVCVNGAIFTRQHYITFSAVESRRPKE